MYSEFRLNANQLDIKFLNSLKALFKDKTISIIVEEEMDETEYLLTSEANRDMLLKSLEQAEKSELIKVNIGKSFKK